MGTDHDNLVAKVRAIMEHVHRDDTCCTGDDTISPFVHHVPLDDRYEETMAQGYAASVDQGVLDLEAVEQAEQYREHRRRNMPNF